MERAHILIVDLRSQLTNNIERTLREQGYRSAILPPEKAAKWLNANPVDAIILSGGDFSVTDEGAPMPPEEVWSAKQESTGDPVPVLGICYGHQLMARRFGGTIGRKPEHGTDTIIDVEDLDFGLFTGTPGVQPVVMNHGDSVLELPPGFRRLATSRESGVIAAMVDYSGQYYGVQFHPEASHTVYGGAILANFADRAGCRKDWSPGGLVDDIRGGIENTLRGRTAGMGVSGGVDSTTLIAIAAPVLKDRLIGITVDADHLRHNELAEIRRNVAVAGLIRHVVVDLRDKVELFAGIIDAQQKRKIFQREIYVPPQQSVIRQHEAAAYLQGTLAPDLIESGETGGALIKTHHNVGIDLGVPMLNPLGNLFKYEVRALARSLSLPEEVWARMPFPGPGLFIRIFGIPVTHELLACVRRADAWVQEILKEDPDFWKEISQLVVAYDGSQTVGQRGDGRCYTGSIVVRAVKTIDFMTAEGLELPSPMRKRIKRTLTGDRLVNRVFFDETDKPTGTTEFE